MTEARQAQLESVRSAAIALVLAIDELIGSEELPDDPNAPCQHPQELRADLAVMGKPCRFQCRACKEIVNE